MQLFGTATSPFVRHCKIALAQTQQDYEFISVDYATTASDSPMKKMPYLIDKSLVLTDSTAIIMHVRQKASTAAGGSAFLQDVIDLELYTMASTLLDTAVNLFLMEKDGITPDNSSYLQRQYDRLASGFKALDKIVQPEQALATDGHIRSAVLIDWIYFRKRYDLNGFDQLNALLKIAANNSIFKQSTPV